MEITELNWLEKTDNFALYRNSPSICIQAGDVPSAPIVSIAIPTFQRADTLREAIQSAINQEGMNAPVEILVVDNNPLRNDQTEHLMTEFPQVVYYKNTENLGMSGNWNRLFELARGKWVLMLHDDDILSRYYLAKVERWLLEDISFLKVRQKTFSGAVPLDSFTSDGKAYRLSLMDLYLGVCFPPSGVLFNRDLVMEMGGFRDDFYPTSDLAFYYAALMNKNAIALDQNLFYYRVEQNASSKKETKDKFIINTYSITTHISRMLGVPPFVNALYQITRSRRFLDGIHSTFGPDYQPPFIVSGNMITRPLSEIVRGLLLLIRKIKRRRV